MNGKPALKQMNNGRIDARVNNRTVLKIKAGFQTIATTSVIAEKKNVQQSLRSYRNHSLAIVVKCCDRYDRWRVEPLWLQRLLNVFSSDSSDRSDDMETSLTSEWQFLVMIYLNLEQCCFQGDRGGGAFAIFFGPILGRLTDLFIPTPGNLSCRFF